MKALIQRVSSASVRVCENTIASIDLGFLVLLGVEQEDCKEDLDYLVRKISKLRVFEDSEGKMNLDLQQVEGKILLVSQFTLLADTRKGNRPSFSKAASPVLGEEYYELAKKAFEAEGLEVQTGQFGASMQVELVNSGPVTIWLDSFDRNRSRKE